MVPSFICHCNVTTLFFYINWKPAKQREFFFFQMQQSVLIKTAMLQKVGGGPHHVLLERLNAVLLSQQDEVWRSKLVSKSFFSPP